MNTLLQTIKLMLDMFRCIKCQFIGKNLYIENEGKTYRIELIEIVDKTIKDIQEAQNEK